MRCLPMSRRAAPVGNASAIWLATSAGRGSAYRGLHYDARQRLSVAEKVAASAAALAPVNTHAHFQRTRFQRPGAGKQCLLFGDSCVDRLKTRIRIRRAAIAGGLEDQAPWFSTDAQEIVVLLQRGA